jgi:hypothetical protein
LLEWDGTTLEATDCRQLFPPTTELATLFYVGGDGQEALPGEPLPQLLEVGVFRGRLPVEGAAVRFETDADGKLAADLASIAGGGTEFETNTGPDGIARCAWLPDSDHSKASQRAIASLLEAAGEPLSPRVDFNAQLSLASQVAYVPHSACADLAGTDTVQEAIDVLCQRPVGGGGCCCFETVEPGRSIEELIHKLLSEGKQAICLCLEAGEHAIERLELEVERHVTLTLSGCGPLTQLRAERLSLANFRTATLQDLDLTLVGDAPLLFEGCSSVTLERCRVARIEVPGLACSLRRATRSRVVASVLDPSDLDAPGLALVPDPRGGEALVDASLVRGSLVLYGEATSELPAREQLVAIAHGLRTGGIELTGNGSVHVRNSSLVRTALDPDMVSALIVATDPGGTVATLRSVHLTDTLVRRGESMLAAKHLVLTAADFAEGDADVGAGVASTAIVTSTKAPDDVPLFVAARDLATAANIRINVVGL